MLKAVLFDVGNVLITWPQAAVDADLKQELGLNDEQLAVFSNKYLYRLGLGEITEEELWAGAKQELGIRDVGVSENLLGRVFEADGNALTDVLELARTLKKRGFTIALLSNTVAAHEKVFTAKGITEPFDTIFLSHKIGLRKPDPKIYLYALSKLGLEPSEVLFIDDTVENVVEAERLGMRTVLAKNQATIVKDIEHELQKDFVGTKVALIHEEKVLTILRDDKAGIGFPNWWDLPGGGREGNETPVEVAIREIQEELDLKLTPQSFIWRRFYPSVDTALHLGCFMVSNLTAEQVDHITLGDEGQKWQFLPFQQFLEHPKVIEGMKTRLSDYLRQKLG